MTAFAYKGASITTTPWKSHSDLEQRRASSLLIVGLPLEPGQAIACNQDADSRAPSHSTTLLLISRTWHTRDPLVHVISALLISGLHWLARIMEAASVYVLTQAQIEYR